MLLVSHVGWEPAFLPVWLNVCGKGTQVDKKGQVDEKGQGLKIESKGAEGVTVLPAVPSQRITVRCVCVCVCVCVYVRARARVCVRGGAVWCGVVGCGVGGGGVGWWGAGWWGGGWEGVGCGGGGGGGAGRGAGVRVWGGSRSRREARPLGSVLS